MVDVLQNPPNQIFHGMFEEVIRWEQLTARGATLLLGRLSVLIAMVPLFLPV